MTRPPLPFPLRLASFLSSSAFDGPRAASQPQPPPPSRDHKYLGTNKPAILSAALPLRFPVTRPRARSRRSKGGREQFSTSQRFLLLGLLLIPVPVMGMEYLTGSANPSSEATEDMKKQSLRAETAMEKCQSTESKDGAIRCPIPCKSSKWYREQDFRAAQDLSDFIVSKASPPYFMGSPPVRATNPLVHDTQFCAWKMQSVDQSLGVPIPIKGYNARCGVREQSVPKA